MAAVQLGESVLGFDDFLYEVVVAGVSRRAGRGNGLTRGGWAHLVRQWSETLAWRFVGGKFCRWIGDIVSLVKEVHFIGDEIGGRVGDVRGLESLHNHFNVLFQVGW